VEATCGLETSQSKFANVGFLKSEQSTHKPFSKQKNVVHNLP
jgi:hypothetical protein